MNTNDPALLTKCRLQTLFLFVLMFVINLSFAFDTSRPNPSKPTTVYILMFMVDIDDIVASEQRFSANFYYEAHWLDKRLAHRGFKIITYPSSKVWTPRLQLANQQRIWKTLPEIVSVTSDGQVTYRQRVWGDFSQPLKLQDFPFDTQIFTINIVAGGYTPEQIHIKAYKDKPSGIADQFSVPDWAVINWYMDNKPYHFIKQGPGLPSMTLNITAKRYIGYYILMYIIPLILIVCMSLIAFWINVKEANTRISIAITSMLTLIAYRFIMGASLPKVSYLTQLDFIILTSTLLVFATLILTAFISLLINNNKLSLAVRIDIHMRWVLPLIFLLLMCLPFIRLTI